MAEGTNLPPLFLSNRRKGAKSAILTASCIRIRIYPSGYHVHRNRRESIRRRGIYRETACELWKIIPGGGISHSKKKI